MLNISQTDKKSIYIRADSSSSIGIGHIMRCLVLAGRYKDSNIIFGTQNLAGNINHKIVAAGHKIDILNSNSASDLLRHLKSYKIDMLIIDHYNIDYKFEKLIKDKTGVKILSLDDTYEKHHCDILLNHNICAEENRYKSLVPSGCEVWCGKSYTLLRDEFKKKYSRVDISTKSINIFVSMGGSDYKNITLKILKTIKKLKNIKVIVVTTLANPNIKQLQTYANKKEWIGLDIDSNKIAEYLFNSDFAIISPSVIANEAYCMNVPFITIKTADNQKDMHRFLKHNGFAVLKKMDKIRLKKSIKKLIDTITKNRKIDAKNR